MKKLPVLAAAAIVTVATAFGAVALHGPSASAEHPADIVGAWEVTAVAPYAPHLFTFNSDGTMLSTNPTNVQESPARPHGGTNDSVGMGTWKVVNEHGDRYVVGTFEELNAFVDNHQPADTLSVSFKVMVRDGGNGFDGPASATVGGETDPSHLTGTRIAVDQAAVDAL
jgi:hypothetical protein